MTRLESIPNVDRLQRRVLRFVASRSKEGVTAPEIEEALGLSHSTVSPRLYELATKDYVREEGVRKTPKGRMAKVWVANYPKAGDPLQLVMSEV